MPDWKVLIKKESSPGVWDVEGATSWKVGDTLKAFVDSRPTAAITYSPVKNVYKQGDILTITATFSENMADSPVPQIVITFDTVIIKSMVKVENNAKQYTYKHTVGTGDGNATITLKNGTDLLGNVVTSTPTSGATFTVDNTGPTADIVYSSPGPYKSGTEVIITATFNEDMKDDPVPQIAITGVNTQTATDMIKESNTKYKYTHTVDAGDGDATIALSTGTDLAGNEITSAPTNNTFVVDNTAPTADITYSPIKTKYKQDDVLTITATFSEAMKDDPKPKIAITGENTKTATDMERVSTTEYKYEHTVDAGDGDATIALSTGTDLAGNEITSAPTNNTFVVDNTAPTAAITYSPIKTKYKQDDVLTITATFNEVMKDDPVPKIAITGGNTQTATNMTKVSTTEYTYDHTVGAGDGDAIITLSNGTDLAGNVLTSNPTSGDTFVVDNTAPTAAITYSPIKTKYKQDDVLTITATFNEVMKDDPVPKIAITGGNTQTATNMTKVSTTEYTYDHTVGAGDGDAIITLSNGTDLAGNVLTSNPTSGDTFVVDNVAPVFTDITPSDNTNARNANVGYTLSEEIASGTVKYTQTDGTADGISPHTITLVDDELNTGTRAPAALTNAPQLVDGAKYTISFDGIDSAGNAATTVTRTITHFDFTAVVEDANKNKLVITFTSDIIGTPDVDKFSVVSGGNNNIVTATIVTVATNKVTLTLTDDIVGGEAVTVSYTGTFLKNALDTITVGNFTNESVTNNVTLPPIIYVDFSALKARLISEGKGEPVANSTYDQSTTDEVGNVLKLATVNGNGIYFDNNNDDDIVFGKNGYCKITKTITFTSERSYESYLKYIPNAAGYNSTQSIIDTGSGGTNNIPFGKPLLMVDTNNILQIKNAGTVLDIGADTTLTENNYHIVMTFDGGNTVDNVKLYVNGALTNTGSFVYSNSDPTVSTHLNIGGKTGTSHLWNGNFNYVKVYTRILTAADITTIYNAL